MILITITYFAGVLTILSPCILPVLPFVFSRSEQPFLKSGLPLLVGMCCTFALFSAIAIAGGEWVIHANQWGRFLSVVFLSLFGIAMIFPEISEKIMSPLVNLGSKIGHSRQAEAHAHPLVSSILIGVSTGLLWAPCAGPILGLVLTGAASQGNTGKSVLLLFSYSLGAATSLALALFAGNRFLAKLKKFLGIDRIVKRALGIAILAGVVSIIFDLDRTLLTHLSKIETVSFENKLLALAGGTPAEQKPKKSMMMMVAGETKEITQTEGTLPEFEKVTAWFNSSPLKRDDLLGKVVLIDFWTYSCINCIRTLPYLKVWSEKYKDDDFLVIGIHAPEFAFEKNLAHVKKAIEDLGISYPVIVDNDYQLWNAFHNRYWPAHYLIDRQGRIRNHHFGEGEYEETEKQIQELISENGGQIHPKQTELIAEGAQKQASQAKILSPETYLGFGRAEHRVTQYETPLDLKLNEWALSGTWFVTKEKAILKKPNGKILYRFRARDLHLVLGSTKSIKFKITLDGHAPGSEHGVDTDADGFGTIHENRLYQLIRQSDSHIDGEHLFEITFFEEGVEAYAFTFG